MPQYLLDMPQGSPRPHPLAIPLRALFTDFLSTLAFLIVFSATGQLGIAVGAGMALGLIQIGLTLRRGYQPDLMQWLSLLLLITFGGASILSQNYVFYRFKFTLIYGVIGAVMLRSGWMVRYLPPIARTYGADLATRFGYIWAGLFLVTAVLNAGFAIWARPHLWAWFIAVVPIGSKAILVGLQYLVMRTIIRRRIRRLNPPPAPLS